ncbi:hypothetical protein B0H63DRAFT_462233 [Podospora didyma]|uniref:proline--tRNA ligase n=1 Tax=Podospora didyma TaxID=330526 RepID=A0AAE0P7P0_9PEZI|nr:hypothetical protein B0H63DRAFT_462233 [Podospora didyma]
MVGQVVSRLSKVWMPSGGFATPAAEDAHSKLIRAGFLRQSHSGIFHMLPLGRRVQDKIEALIARHMEESLGASRVSLSSLSAQTLWKTTGRFQNIASELFTFSDRKDVGYLLSPTHEEEITSLVGKTVKSYKELPLRLYQITRKYRDELRPRHGLLRGREFTMKDLYTFDSSVVSALETYEKVRVAYSNIFAEMKLPVLAAKASSGDMGGDISHEYHLPLQLGEDRVVSCNSCDYAANEEIAETIAVCESSRDISLKVWRGITKDRATLVNVWYPKGADQVDGKYALEYTSQDINKSAVKSVVPDLITDIEHALPLWKVAVSGESKSASRILNIVDGRVPVPLSDAISLAEGPGLSVWPDELDQPQPPLPMLVYRGEGENPKPLNLLRIREGDRCPQCSSGTLKVENAIELGHTFHLGTRYSEPLKAGVFVPHSKHRVPMQMGCHGIGISRMIGAVAEHLADSKGLNWPISIAPYACVIIPGNESDEGDAMQVHQHILASAGAQAGNLDAVVDDRNLSLPYKLTDADLAGFPVIVILGREWHATRRVEVQCRQLGFKEILEVKDLAPLFKHIHASL